MKYATMLIDPMKIAAFQHVPNEPLGYFETFFAEKGIPFEYIRLFETNEVPRTDADHLVFLGGPMSVNDEQEFPWLKEEKELIRRAVKKKDRVLGICLGAQLIASAHGAPVYKYVTETGWTTVHREPVSDRVFSRFPEQFPVFQLHGETFGIPYGGIRVCSGDRVKNQALAIETALGLQFHLELTEEIVQDWSRGLRKFTRESIRRDTPRFLPESNRLCRIIAEDFIGR